MAQKQDSPEAQDALKQAVGEAAALQVKDAQVVGLGTGSTTEFALHALADRIKGEGLQVIGVATSTRSEQLAKRLGIPLSTLADHPEVDLTIDGADEVDPDLDLVKGGGGALTREKIVAAATKKEIIVVDPSKLVQMLGRSFPLPVEVVPMAVANVRAEIETMGAEVERRRKGGNAVKTDNGMAVLDCRFPKGIENKRELERELNLIPGVLENGLFLGLADEVLVGTAEGVKRLKPGQGFAGVS